MANHQRPLSPHLQVYRWQIQMVTSILHRATGMILAVGALLIAWALLALAAGPEQWARFADIARSPLGFLVLFGWTWAFAYHLINGVRHLIQDAGHSFDIPGFIRNSWISVIGSLVLTALVWIVAMMQGGAA
ncbi:succinate dehydrogenase, cytochrome b556 subunit [Lysobacter sp. GX 14042]|uniref:succinate dehydrogenase, cytochrome b556 subunit n=1 Tax=Lysobacter sp. GX 14042 TaxID=2907155 RepID=UPI001F2C0E39|nr:succinate dehydrogenase, cytochrome b556 subunit [Lysobacter sp. GX 14042]MCE7031515.1 succinate dehydrogenase, cytochrome b556 subunit [Lysobacter sp. GX 14042]